MTITYTLPGFKLVNQLGEATADGYPDENARENCVPASISAALDYLTGGAFDGDELKDAAYGQGYVGPGSAARYEAFCAAHGVTLAPHDDTQAGLIATIHAQVDHGYPCLVTMPSQWGTAPADPVHPVGSTHVGVACGTGPGEIRVMNPWGGFWQDEPDSWWQARLCYGQVWPMQKVSVTTMSGVPSGWSDDGTTLTGAAAPDGQRYPCVHGMRAFVLSNNWDASDVPVGAEQGESQVEIGHAALGGGVVQWFLKSGQLSWVKGFNGDASFRTWNGQEEKALRAALSASETAEQQTQSQLASANATITQLQAELTAAQNQPAPAPTPQERAAASLVAAMKVALNS